MKKVTVYFLLLIYLNLALVAQVNEIDFCNVNHQQVDDVNSIFELVRTAIGYDHVADDEDDDIEDFGFFTQSFVCTCPDLTRFTTSTDDYNPIFFDSSTFSIQHALKLQRLFYDVDAPPPRA